MTKIYQIIKMHINYRQIVTNLLELKIIQELITNIIINLFQTNNFYSNLTNLIYHHK